MDPYESRALAGSPPPRTHSLAVVSLVCAVLGCCVPILAPVLAVAFGVIASSEIRARPETYVGRELAFAGIVLGAVVLFLTIVGLFVLYAAGLNEDSVSALMETPPAVVFLEEEVPTEAVTYLRENGFISDDERILLYYDDSVMEKFAALSVLTDRRVVTVFDDEPASIPLGDVAGVQYERGSYTRDHVIHVHAEDGRQLALTFTEGADVQGFAERITELVARNGGAELTVE